MEQASTDYSFGGGGGYKVFLLGSGLGEASLWGMTLPGV
jgi:hypothetical protein